MSGESMEPEWRFIPGSGVCTRCRKPQALCVFGRGKRYCEWCAPRPVMGRRLIEATEYIAEVAALRAELAAYRERDRWIPVEEALPEQGVDVETLCADPGGVLSDGGVMLISIFFGTWRDVSGEALPSDWRVAYWRHQRPVTPLPEVAKDGAT